MSAVTWSPDGKYLASASNDGTISIRNASNGKEVPPSSGRPFQGTTVAWSPHDRAALALVFGDDVEIWDVTRGELIFVYPHKGATMLAWSSDGTHIASASFSGGEIQVWDIRYQRNVCTYTHASTVMAIAWSPDGRRIVSAGWATVQICNSANGKPLFTYHGHTQMVNAVAWSPDGTRIASAGNRNSTDDLLDPESYKLVHVWNATTGNLVFAYQGHATEVSAVAWSPNGKLIASAGAVSWDATVQIWSPGATA